MQVNSIPWISGSECMVLARPTMLLSGVWDILQFHVDCLVDSPHNIALPKSTVEWVEYLTWTKTSDITTNVDLSYKRFSLLATRLTCNRSFIKQV